MKKPKSFIKLHEEIVKKEQPIWFLADNHFAKKLPIGLITDMYDYGLIRLASEFDKTQLIMMTREEGVSE